MVVSVGFEVEVAFRSCCPIQSDHLLLLVTCFVLVTEVAVTIDVQTTLLISTDLDKLLFPHFTLRVLPNHSTSRK